MMYRLKTYGLILTLLVMTLLSCKDEDIVFYSFAPVPLAWSKNEPAVITLPDSMPKGEYKWDIEVRNLALYPYKNLWMEMEVESQKEGKPYIYSHTLHFYLTDSIGHWKDENTLGTYFVSTFPQENLFVIADSTCNYQVRFRHIMEDEKLIGISDIGIKLTKNTP